MHAEQDARNRVPRGWLPAALALAAIVFATDAASAAARIWENPVLVSPVNKAAISPTVGIDAAGTATLIWAGQDNTAGSAQPPHQIRLGTRTAGGGTWIIDETARSGPRTRSALISVADNGAAAVAWLELSEDGAIGKAWAMGRGTAGGFGDAVQLSDNALGAQFSAALDAAGNGAIAWESIVSSTARPQVRTVSGGALAGTNATLTGNPESFQTTRRRPDVAIASAGPLFAFDRAVLGNPKPALVTSAGGVFGAPTELTPPGTGSPANPAIAVLPGGGVAAAWNQSDGRVYARVGTAETPQALSNDEALSPELAAASDGTLVAAWRQDDEPAAPFAGWHVYAAVRGPGATSFGPAVQVSDEAETFNGLDQPVLAFAGNDAIVAWSRDTGSLFRVETSQRPAGGSFQAIADRLSGPLGGNDGDARSLTLAANPTGEAVLAWLQPFADPLGGQPYFRVVSSRSQAGGSELPGGGGGGNGGGGGGAPSSGGSPTANPSAAAPVKPLVTGFRVSRERFAPGKRDGAVAAGKGEKTVMYPKGQSRSTLRVGTQLLFNSNVAGQAVVKVVGTGCTKFLPAGKEFDEERSRKCTAAKAKTTIKATAAQGPNRIPYLGKGLTPGGDYRATLTVTDSAGRASEPRSTEFSLDAAL